MSDCIHPEGISGIAPTVINWQREFVANWADQARKLGEDKSFAGSTYIGLMERAFNTAPITAGLDLAKAATSGDTADINQALGKFDALGPSAKVEAGCLALSTNNQARQDVQGLANLPKIELVTSRTNDGEPALKQLTVKSASGREIAKKEF